MHSQTQLAPYPPGFVDTDTGRVAVLVREYANSDLNGDVPAYWRSAQAEWGADPWWLLDGVDTHTDSSQFDVWFVSGSSRTVGPLATLFLSAADAAKLAALNVEGIAALEQREAS